jgi:hypothetical protein
MNVDVCVEVLVLRKAQELKASKAFGIALSVIYSGAFYAVTSSQQVCHMYLLPCAVLLATGAET